jgi:hypothetical protein
MIKKIIKLITILIVLALLVYGGFKVYNSFSTVSYSANGPTKGDTETEDLLSKVGKLAELPVGENPTIATVSDLNALKGQPFFSDAMVGDKVIIYSTSGKAILYRPSTNKIIVIAPINK